MQPARRSSAWCWPMQMEHILMGASEWLKLALHVLVSSDLSHEIAKTVQGSSSAIIIIIVIIASASAGAEGAHTPAPIIIRMAVQSARAPTYCWPTAMHAWLATAAPRPIHAVACILDAV